MRELRILTEVEHRNLPRLSTVFEGPTQLIYLLQTDFSDPKNTRQLEDWAKTEKTLNEVCSVVRQLVDFLEHVHAKHFVLRDFSLQNIVVGPDFDGNLLVQMLGFSLIHDK